MITCDLTKLLSVLEALNQSLSSEQLQSKLGDDYVTSVLDYIASGQSFTPRTGNLQHSISWQPTANKDGITVISVIAQTAYAQTVEFGDQYRRAFPFIYADLINRETVLKNSVLSVLNTTITEAQ
jgi:hypothetical protein